MIKISYKWLLLLVASVSVSACGGFRAYDEPRSEPRSWVQVANHSDYDLEVFAYNGGSCNDQNDIGRFGSVPSGHQNKPATPRAIASGERTVFCIDAYDYDNDLFICRRGVAIDAVSGNDYRIDFHVRDNRCVDPQVAILPKGYIKPKK